MRKDGEVCLVLTPPLVLIDPGVVAGTQLPHWMKMSRLLTLNMNVLPGAVAKGRIYRKDGPSICISLCTGIEYAISTYTSISISTRGFYNQLHLQPKHSSPSCGGALDR